MKNFMNYCTKAEVKKCVMNANDSLNIKGKKEHSQILQYY